MASHTLHTARVPKNTSSVPSAAISRQNGQNAMTASHSSAHLHRLATRIAQPQQMGCEQHLRCVTLRRHSSVAQNAWAQMKHESSSSPSVSPPPPRETVKGMDTSMTP